MTPLRFLGLVFTFAILATTPASWAVPDRKPTQDREVRKRLVNTLGMRFVWIAPGTFLMGSSPEEKARRSDETQHRVTLTKGFYMGVHLVTQEEWQIVMGSNPGQFRGGKNLPVEQVSWDDCQEFIRKLGERDRRTYRLPTEAEWEYACRAGTTTPLYFGETISTDQANYHGDFIYGNGAKGLNRARTTPVDEFPANKWGLYDMTGNVRQWCQDWHAPFSADDVVDPKGPDAGTARVNRGGSFYLNPGYSRSASRGYYSPPSRFIYIGCRLCMSAD